VSLAVEEEQAWRDLHLFDVLSSSWCFFYVVSSFDRIERLPGQCATERERFDVQSIWRQM